MNVLYDWQSKDERIDELEAENYIHIEASKLAVSDIRALKATIKLQQGAIAAKDKFNRQQQATIERVRDARNDLATQVTNSHAVKMLDLALGDKV